MLFFEGNAKTSRAAFGSVQIDQALCGSVKMYRSAWQIKGSSTAVEDAACPVRAYREYSSEGTQQEKDEIEAVVDPFV